MHQLEQWAPGCLQLHDRYEMDAITLDGAIVMWISSKIHLKAFRNPSENIFNLQEGERKPLLL